MKRIIVLLSLVLWATPAWSSELWVMFLDLSGSVGEPTGGTPLARNLSQVESTIASTGKETTIIVIGFGRRSDAALLKAVMPKQAGPQEKYLKATRQAAFSKLRENLSAKLGTIDRSRSDVHGAIMRSARIFSENGGVKKLFLYSDMLDNETFGLTIERLAAGQTKAAKAIYPDLKGVSIYCWCAFADSDQVNTRRLETAIVALKNFWTSYFEKTNGSLVDYRTMY